MKVFALCSMIVVLLIFGIARSVHKSRSLAQDRPLPDIVNETESFQVESLTGETRRLDTGEMRYVLKLKNVSAKKITAYMIKYPSGVIKTADFVVTDGGLAPGSIEEVDIYDTLRPDTLAQSSKITIVSVVFEDGSSEGDFNFRKRIMESRLGAKMGFERINNILQEALRLKRGEVRESETSKKEWLEQVISDISELPDQAPAGQSLAMGSGFRGGFHYAKETTLINLKALNEWRAANQSDSTKAAKILSERSEISGTRDLTDGVTRIIRYNETQINRHKEGLNEK